MRKLLPTALLLMATLLFALQLRSLFFFPAPNSFRWFGDETWLMSEAHEQITTGAVRYPLAIGSQLERGKGLVLSMTWLSALLYGLPVWVAAQDPVSTGRCVTAALALLLLITLFASSRALGASRFASALAVLLFVSTRSFFFASHSARPDLLAGLIVLLAVALGTRYSERMINVTHATLWWFEYGAIFMFFAVSSSIHLLTLLAPIALFFFWRRTNNATPMSRTRAAIACAGGVLAMLAVLTLAYYAVNASLQLFPASAEQFHDVLHSIPILRPFSRSVQVANFDIRFKQFLAEAPIVFLLPLTASFLWRKGTTHTFAKALLLVGLSWLLLEGAEINYLIHVLPILFLGLAIAISRLTERWNVAQAPFAILAVIVFTVGWRDSGRALVNASIVGASNQDAARRIGAYIDSTWRQPSKPLVLTEPPMLDPLSQDSSIQIMTDHFISFPLRSEPLDSFLIHEHVNYAVLYNSPVYPKNRPRDDPFYREVARLGQLIALSVGTSGDVGRDYFHHSDWQDTVLLFTLNLNTAPKH